MNLVSLRLIRDVLLRTAGISFLLTIVMALITVTFWHTWSGITCSWYHVSPETIGPVVLNYFALIKFYYLFVLLAPALALHWTIKAEEKRLGKQ